MMKKHTEGPWRITNHKNPDLACDGYQFIEAGNGFHDEKSDSGFWIANFMSDADARLIAAAPDLLEALKRCRFDSLNMTMDDMKFCSAAIAKATGGE
jgi:hypothetical protein